MVNKDQTHSDCISFTWGLHNKNSTGEDIVDRFKEFKALVRIKQRNELKC
jgi:hypothetical protein